jgi:hypothetical protein
MLVDVHHPHWLSAWKFVVEQGYGRAPATIETHEAEKPTTIIRLFGQDIRL